MVEVGTGRTSLLGLIRVETLREFPGRTCPMTVFLHLVDGIGEYATTIEIHDLAEHSIIHRMKGPRIYFPSRPSSHQLSLSVPALPIAHPGRYDVVVLGNGKEIDRQQFRAQLPKNIGENP
jgi:hypothetical protein